MVSNNFAEFVITTETCIQDFIEARVQRSPRTLALSCEEEKLTYQALNQRANQLAHYLRSRGVSADMVVGVCTTRSMEMVVGILGILKAGGAYLPLDPAYPQERLAFILEDAQVSLVVSQSEVLEALPQHAAEVICLDRDWAKVANCPGENPPKIASAKDLAYVIYTSGSTGKPKGVMIPHRSLCHFVQIVYTALDISEQDVYLHTASVAYALSVRQLMVPLAYGAAIVLATSAQARDPLLMFELIKAKKITLMDVVPSFWRTTIQRLAELPAEERQQLLDNHLRRIVSIGEPLLSDIPFTWRNDFQHQANLVNIFGQTETTGVVATYPIPPEQPDRVEVVPIGRSVPGTQLYILDSDFQPVKAGESGELCVSSPCLARGYLNRPDLTEAKFVTNPFNDGISDRLYRTGDLARCNADGVIEFLGRGDHQVKIRGQRLELGEVEIVLREHPGVSNCVVSVRGDEPDNKYLVAYVVPAADQSLAPADLRDFMRQRVPDYMVPAAYVFLEALPVTPNGKIDRLALPAHSWSAPSDQPRAVDKPRNDLDRQLIKIWQELFKLDQVSIHDNFFDLGGHSFLGVRLFACIERDLGVRLPLTTLFQAETIAQLSDVMATLDDSQLQWSPLVPINPTNSDRPPFFGIHGLEGGVLFWRDVVMHLPDDQPFYALQAQGVDGLRPALTRIETMASLYVEAIRQVQPHGPYYLGGFSMGGEIAFEVGQQLFRQGEKVAFLLMLDTKNPVRSGRPLANKGDGAPIPVVESRAVDPSMVLKQKIQGHMKRLASASMPEKLAYVAGNVEYRVKRGSIYTAARLYRLLGKRLPDSLLLQYLRMSHSQALRDYVPILYPGRITLFRSSESEATNPDDSPLGWGPLTAAGLDVFHFKASHNIIDAEYAQEVAHKLMECLDQARGSQS
ncbi:MAG TPA: amino acid adenylation domain-containing protein [Anaerolineae bacterium]|nr:amino acid adenylation domain-containing protein [Anaerolineae bacterium]